MTTETENPPAFPRDHRHLGHNGMSLRDYFAGRVDVSAYRPRESFATAHSGQGPTIAELAEYIAAIRLIEADAMLAARA